MGGIGWITPRVKLGSFNLNRLNRVATIFDYCTLYAQNRIMRQIFHRETLIRIGLLLISMSVAIVISEIGLRVLYNGYDYVWPPYLHKTFKPLPRLMPGIEGESRFIVNSKGIRGDEFLPDYSYRILTIGCSTTKCLFLDQSEAWPYLLQKKLNERGRDHRVWIGNVGKSGLDTRDHILQMRYLLSEYPNINAVIMLIGINDLLLRLSQDLNYNAYYRRTAIWHFGRKIKLFLSSLQTPSQQVQDEAGKIYITWREHRHNAGGIRNTLPDLSSALEEYSRNINTIIDLAKNRSVQFL